MDFFAEIFAGLGIFPAVEKSTIINLVRDAVKAQYERMLEAARETASGVTDPENKAEHKYDTRGLEASYLAAGQGEQAEALAEAVLMFQEAAFPKFEEGSEIAAGAVGITMIPGRILVGFVVDRLWAPGVALVVLLLPAQSCSSYVTV